jgi:hypothetical protein
VGLIPREADSGRFGCREGLGLVGVFHKRKATFWATLERYRRRETAPPLAKNTSVAMQQRPRTERARRLFSSLPTALGNRAQPARLPLFPQPRMLLLVFLRA